MLYLVGCKTTTAGHEYTGTLSKTMSGRTCQFWNNQAPHLHPYWSKTLPEGNQIDAKNYCRNPDNDTFPMCYTTDPAVTAESCNVPFCSKHF